MICSTCGHENRESARFCGACAAPIASDVSCGACGTRNPIGQNFCDACGGSLSAGATVPNRPEPAASPPSTRPGPASYTPPHLAQRILRMRSAIEGERKHVTVLFADIVDSVPLAERTDPEEMHALMDGCFQKILPEVHRYEGTINQFQGDGFMALFGAPLALENAPRRACLAALAIQRALAPVREDVRARHGVDLEWRIGIHTGPVVVGRIGDDLRMDYTAVGDTTNLAARLEKAAPPGAILISQATRRLVEGFFEFEDLGAIALKGKAEPVRMYRVLAERAVVGRIEAAGEAGLTPLCGRERELELLVTSLGNASAGRGQVALVVGEAGIGKSRLLHEFRRSLGDANVAWFMGQCSDCGDATAFEPIIDGLRRRFGIEDTDDETAAIARVERAVAELGGELAWTLPLLRSLLSLKSGDAEVDGMAAVTRRSETVRALTALFVRASERQPLVFAIEDLHWIDAASEEFVNGLADSIPTARMLILLTYRPGYQPPMGDRTYHTRITLQALSERETARMAGALLEGGELPDALRRLISAKAEGNPLFIEEVTRSLVEEGVLRIENGAVELSRALSDVSIPDSLHDVLMARIDRLDEEPKRAIQVASVIGREFALRLLQRISEAGDAVDSVVSELRGLELIYEKSAHPELAFMFKHALTCDVAYASVLVQRRRALHGIVGRAIEELYRDRLAEHYEKLAYHFTLAENWDKALVYHENAAEKAEDTYANAAAAEHCRKAIAIAERMSGPLAGERLARLYMRLGGACFALSDFDQSANAFRGAARHGADPVQGARNLARAGYSMVWGHRYDEGRACAVEARTIAREHGAKAEESMGLLVEDHLNLVLGEAFHGDLCAAGLELAEQARDPEALATLLAQAAGRLERRGEFRQAIAVSERALEIARKSRLMHLAAFPQWYLGLALCCLGEYGRAVAVMRDDLELCDRLGDSALKPRILNTLGFCFAEFHAHERASEYNRHSTVLARRMVDQELVPGAPELYANAAINLTGNLIGSGDLDAATEALAPIEEGLSRDGDPWMRWRYKLHVIHAQARIALSHGEVDSALSLTADELAGARESDSRKIEARALELQGRALVTADLRDRARETLVAALSVARAIEYPPVVWRAESLLAELDRRSGRAKDAERRAATARNLALRCVETLTEPELRKGLTGLAQALVSDPVGAYR